MEAKPGWQSRWIAPGWNAAHGNKPSQHADLWILAGRLGSGPGLADGRAFSGATGGSHGADLPREGHLDDAGHRAPVAASLRCDLQRAVGIGAERSCPTR